jgi:hypothetical protein
VNRLVLVALCLCGCLSRTDVGVEPPADAGLDASGSAGNGGLPLPDDEIAIFERRLLGGWEDEIRSRTVHFEFRDDHTVIGCIDDGCFINGEYRVTDILLDGSAIVQGRNKNGMPFALTDVVLRGDEVRFVTFINALQVEFELERVKQASDGEL